MLKMPKKILKLCGRPLVRRATSIGCAGLLILLLAACGDGGSDSSGGASTGSVALLLTDAPIDDFVQVLVTVTRIELLPGDGDDDGNHETIFEGRETFDLLALENVNDPFAIADDVPSGFYEKLRMEVDEIELVRSLGDGQGTESVFPRLPSGRIDLNPQGGFVVVANSTLGIRLDVDARRSIHVVETGSGETIFRPQVFVDIMSEGVSGRLIFVEGIVREIDRDASPVRILLCEVEISHRDRDGRSDQHCLNVFADDETAVFDELDEPSDLDEIDLTERIGVFGHFALDDDDHFAIDAEVIEIGGSSAFLTLTGIVVTNDDPESDDILLELDPAQGFGTGTVLAVDLQDETRIFSSSGEPLDPAEIVVGTRLEVDGVLVLSEDSPDTIRAAIVFVQDVIELFEEVVAPTG